jgi:hypothetical protein
MMNDGAVQPGVLYKIITDLESTIQYRQKVAEVNCKKTRES